MSQSANGKHVEERSENMFYFFAKLSKVTSDNLKISKLKTISSKVIKRNCEFS